MLRLGDRARGLSEQDVASIQAVLPQGQRPWLLVGVFCAMCVPSVSAFLPPTTETAEIRRGAVTVLRPPPATPGPTSPAWTVAADTAYAQVVVAGRAFDQIQGDEDANQPFTVQGNFSDSELLSVVRFVRSFSENPVRTLRRDTSAEVTVFIRRGNADSLRVTLGLQDGRWVVLASAYVSA